jgi:hypothetical protein
MAGQKFVYHIAEREKIAVLAQKVNGHVGT